MAAKKTPSFEDRLRRLQEVVASLENGDHSTSCLKVFLPIPV